jgi:uncharacterized protein YbaA (DUF1428 family)
LAIQTSPRTTGQPADATTPYVDGFVIAVPRDRLDDYEQIARDAAAVWRKYGALRVVEAVADDVPHGEVTSFPRAVRATEDETVIFSWIAYESREARDEVNAKVMADPRIKDHMDEVPFDPKRMIFGGFRTIVEL